jgi:hypothetical protein
MKKLYLLISLAFISAASHSQGWSQPYTINFESPDSILSIDTVSGNIWQIGRPSKTFFNNANSLPNAIVTDTLNYYPPNNLSSFKIKVYDPAWGPVWNFYWIGVYFSHKYDTDSLHDGGYIETSYDSGATWTNVANDPYINWGFPYYYDSPATIANGNRAYTGKSYNSGWETGNIVWCWFPNIPNVRTTYLRFVFYSDSVQNNKEGWMIDDIIVFEQICEGVKEIINENSLSIFPNPVHDHFIINHSGEVEIYNVMEEKCLALNNVQKGKEIHVDLVPGVYLARVKDKQELYTQKLIIE